MNIYDIAELAGVSIATVSRVVNDSPRVSEKTKQRVRAIMEENGYTPNVFARPGAGLHEDHRDYLPGCLGFLYGVGGISPGRPSA